MRHASDLKGHSEAVNSHLKIYDSLMRAHGQIPCPWGPGGLSMDHNPRSNREGFLFEWCYAASLVPSCL